MADYLCQRSGEDISPERCVLVSPTHIHIPADDGLPWSLPAHHERCVMRPSHTGACSLREP